LWQKPNNSLVVWFRPGAVAKPVVLSNLPRTDARVVGVNDLNQDNKLDLIWRHPGGHLSAWWMSGTNTIGSFPINGGQIVSPALKYGAPKN